jgi:hypothetical protein
MYYTIIYYYYLTLTERSSILRELTFLLMLEEA